VHYETPVPTVRDRVAQMATLLILEPIFEADFLDCSYGFRPGRSAH
jgi:RNA-directed DNA polymerase